MKTARVALTIASLGLLGPSWADVRSIWPVQRLAAPNSSYYSFGQDVAIDGGSIIVLGAYDGGQAALLYRRDSTGNFKYWRVLRSRTGPYLTGEVAMKNGIAAVRFGNHVTIYEASGGDYVRGPSTAPIWHPGGLAISRNSVLIGGNGCDYDGVVYQKGADGNWGVTGRMDDNQGECHPEGMTVELNYDYALLGVPFTHEARAWRRNGSALDWLPAGTLTVPPDVGVTDGPYALQGSTAVAPGNFVFRRNGNTWTGAGKVEAVNNDNTLDVGFAAVYRDGVLLTSEKFITSSPYAYVETSPGQFEHVAVLNTFDNTEHYDISNRTVVAATRSFIGTTFGVDIFKLPTQLHAPRPVVNDFEALDVSGFTFTGGQFALAKRGIDDVLAQTYANGLAIGLLNDSDWSDYQRVSAEITPSFGVAGSWVGLVAHYVDADNYYFAVIRGDETFGIYRRRNGVDTLLSEGTYYAFFPAQTTLIVDGTSIALVVNSQYNFAQVTDSSPIQGRAGVATSQARADFDDIHVAGSEQLGLLFKDYSAYGGIYGQNFTERGGNWQPLQDEEGNNAGFAQLNPNGVALAYIGTPTENQEIIARARLDSFNSAVTGAWFGLLARYVDPQNYYYVAVRSTNTVQIRKRVNGVVTVLAAASFTTQPPLYNNFRFRVINDQLQLFVDDVLVASAHDDDLARGQYGLATSGAAATWESVEVMQP